MGDDSGDISNLESRHRKEKKELQAQIQAMKKTAKNDKTKKKELITEIARLECDLESRHKCEMESWRESNIDTVEVDLEIENEYEEIKPKVSKAQKRRDKKTKLEKERDEQIKLQEKENIHGPRNLETQAINTKLKDKQLQIFQIPSDGDCLYKAVAHQLNVIKKQSFTVEELRNDVAKYISENKDDFILFMSNPETCEMLTDAEFSSYCDKIKNTNVWGGQLELRALSNFIKCPIIIIQATGPDSIEQGSEFEGPPLVITYHRHMYKLGEHYNSTIQCEEQND